MRPDRKYSIKEIQEATDAIQKLADYANKHHDMTPLFLAMHQTHRTLQQKIFGFFLLWINQMALYKEFDYDLRNEAAVHLAKKIVEQTAETKSGLPYI